MSPDEPTTQNLNRINFNTYNNIQSKRFLAIIEPESLFGNIPFPIHIEPNHCWLIKIPVMNRTSSLLCVPYRSVSFHPSLLFPCAFWLLFNKIRSTHTVGLPACAVACPHRHPAHLHCSQWLNKLLSYKRCARVRMCGLILNMGLWIRSHNITHAQLSKCRGLRM